MRLLRFVVVLFPALALAHAQDITGDWLGTLSTPAADLRLALHISKADSGLKATLDSVDQGVSGLPVESLKLADSRLSFQLSSPQASFDGQVDAAATNIDGTFASSAGSAPFTFRRGTVAKTGHKPAKPTDIDGDWTGTLSVTGHDQTYLFHMTNTEDGLIVTMDLPDEHIQAAPASSVKRSDASLSIEWSVFGSRFDGKIVPDRSAIEGEVSQAGMSFPFTMKRVKP